MTTATVLEVYSKIGKGDFEIESKIESTIPGWMLRQRELNIHASNGKTYQFKVRIWHDLASTNDKVSKIHFSFELYYGVHMQWTSLIISKKDNSIIVKSNKIKFHPAASEYVSRICCRKEWTCGTINRSDLDIDILIKIDITVTDDESLIDEPSWSKTIANLYDKETMSDVKIICDKITFNCHKFVLANRSDVFEAMFANMDTKEMQDQDQDPDQIKIDDVSNKTMKNLLSFVYKNKISANQDIDDKLLIAADKYNITDLCNLCSRHLIKTINVDNAIDLLFVGYLVNNTELMESVTKFASKNQGKVKKSKNWNEIQKSYPDIASKLLDAILFSPV
jgi:hypothetical protein